MDVINDGDLKEDRPMHAVDGKKCPKLFDKDNGLVNSDEIIVKGKDHEEEMASSTSEPARRVNRAL